MNHVYLYRIMIFQEKKLGSVRTLFLLAASIYSASKTEFTNNSLKSPKIEKLIIDTLIIPQGLSIHGKTRVCSGLFRIFTVVFVIAKVILLGKVTGTFFMQKVGFSFLSEALLLQDLLNFTYFREFLLTDNPQVPLKGTMAQDFRVMLFCIK